MKKIIKIRLQIIITATIMFAASFIPQMESLKSVFYKTVYGCNNSLHRHSSVHEHWTAQHWIWMFTGIALLIMQIVLIIIEIQKVSENKNK